MPSSQIYKSKSFKSSDKNCLSKTHAVETQEKLKLMSKNIIGISLNSCARAIMQSALHKKMKFSIKDFFSKCDQIRRKMRI